VRVLEGVLEHVGNDSSKKRTGQFETWVGVGFDEPDFEVVVYEEV